MGPWGRLGDLGILQILRSPWHFFMVHDDWIWMTRVVPAHDRKESSKSKTNIGLNGVLYSQSISWEDDFWIVPDSNDSMVLG
jgi:uncharacterized protein YfaT (DUF1175 family)